MLKSILYPLGCVFIPVIIYMLCYFKKNNKNHFRWSLIFVLYLFLVIMVTGIGSIFDIYDFKTMQFITIDHTFVLIPFKSGINMSSILNIIMFMPFGFLLPMIFTDYKQLNKVIILSIVTTILIETMQLFTGRICDVEDIIMNVSGAIIGFFLWKNIGINIFKEDFKRSMMLSINEPTVYVLLSFISSFLLYNWKFSL